MSLMVIFSPAPGNAYTQALKGRNWAAAGAYRSDAYRSWSEPGQLEGDLEVVMGNLLFYSPRMRGHTYARITPRSRFRLHVSTT